MHRNPLMNYIKSLLIITFCVMLSPVSIRAMKASDETNNSGSFPYCETLYKTFKKKGWFKACDHCACLPHCCCSSDCITLCKHDVTEYCPMVTETYNDNGLACALIVATIYPPACVEHHLQHAREKRATPIAMQMK